MPAQPDILLQCFNKASALAQPALARCIDQAIAELQLLETQNKKVAERDELASSWRYLQAHKLAWSERYAVDLLADFTKAADSKHVSPSATPKFSRSGPAAFGLVDDAALNQAIDGQRLLQNLLPGVEQKLAELNALISSAMGLGYVAPERNPLRPEVFTRVLQSLASSTVESSAVTAFAFKALTKPLGHELLQIYSDCINTLNRASVTAASYQFRLQPSAPPSQKPQQPGSLGATGADYSGDSNQNGSGQADMRDSTQGYMQSSGSAAPRSTVNLSDSVIKTGLLQDFLLSDHPQSADGLSSLYYDDLEQELADLVEARDSSPAALEAGEQARMDNIARMPAVDRPLRPVNGSSALNEQVWGPYGTSRARAMVRTQIKKEATKVSQALGLEVVRELVNQVAQDPRLLAPVREAIVALEPALLRLALVDPRFFSDERHPGRQLMERVAQRSFSYNDEFSDPFAVFFKDICDSFNQLNAATISDAQPFAVALAKLEQTWDAYDKEDFDKRQQVLQGLRFAEERQARADHIAYELSSRSDLQQVPGKVLDFLFGPWSLVMAHARLVDTRNQIDPGGYGSVVPDLVWSVKSEVTLKQPAKLIEMIPALLEKLHQGLALLGQDPRENEVFFESLMKLHRPVLKLRRFKSQRDAQESMAALLEPEEPMMSPAVRLENLRAQADEAMWLARDELEAAGFEDTLATMPGELPTDDESGAESADSSAPAPTGPTNLRSEAEQDPHRTPEDPGQAAVQNALPVAAESNPEQTKEQAKEQAAVTLRGLRTGHWVDLYSKHQWLRAQLVWASSKATLFMFISHGGRPHSMTQRSCEKLIAQRLLRPVDAHGVIAQALDGVAVVAEAQRQAAHAGSASSSARNELEPA